MQTTPLPYAYELVQSLTEGMIVIGPDGRIVFANLSAGRIIERQVEDLMGQPLEQVFPAVVGGKPLVDYLASDSAPLPVNIRLQSGREVSLAFTRASFATAEGSLHTALVFRDVTESSAAQQVRSYFLANISHEFRTPLSALKASVELLLDNVSDLTQEEIVSLLNSIHYSLTGLQTLIDNLLESVSIEAGRFQIRKRSTDLNALAGEAAKIVKPLLDRRKQELKISAAPDLPHASVDPMRLTQVLVNLLSNASKYGPMEKPIDLRLDREGNSLKFSVADQGDGIPEEDRQNIFRRFIRLDHKDKPQYGIGLGLSLVKTIVEGHGGSVGLDGRPGGGSIFWFTIPLENEGRH